MAAFIYYLPNVQNMDIGSACPELREIVADRIITWREARGPGGGSGQTITLDDVDGEATGYFPDLQVWAKSVVGPHWVGYEKAAPPTPERLERPRLIKGRKIELNRRSFDPERAAHLLFTAFILAFTRDMMAMLTFFSNDWPNPAVPDTGRGTHRQTLYLPPPPSYR